MGYKSRFSEFNNFIWAMENVLDNAEIGNFWWSQVKDSIISNSIVSKQIIKDMVLIEKKNNALDYISYDLDGLLLKINNTKTDYTDSEWFLELHNEVMNYKKFAKKIKTKKGS